MQIKRRIKTEQDIVIEMAGPFEGFDAYLKIFDEGLKSLNRGKTMLVTLTVQQLRDIRDMTMNIINEVENYPDATVRRNAAE